jgi:hypothetical protein
MEPADAIHQRQETIVTSWMSYYFIVITFLDGDEIKPNQISLKKDIIDLVVVWHPTVV